MSSRSSFLIGLIGASIQASRSPQLHEEESRALGLRYSYQLLDLQERGAAALPQFLDAAELLGFAGVNVTHPCKQTVLPLLHELSEEAAAIGAVNTVCFTQGKRIGHNTDWLGFAESFRRGLPEASLRNVVLPGAGGAGAAIAYAMMKMGVQRLIVYDVVPTRLDQLVKKLTAQFAPERVGRAENLAEALSDADGLIQATPIGMEGHPGLPLPVELLRSHHWVTEAIYFPRETDLLRQARSHGCRTLDGGGMAVFQAAEAFRLFTGIAPNVDRMWQHFLSLYPEDAD